MSTFDRKRLVRTVAIFALFSLFYTTLSGINAEKVEEFFAHGPMDFHNAAMDAFIKLRKEDPTQNLSLDGEFLQSANDYAVKRGVKAQDESLKIRSQLMINSVDTDGTATDVAKQLKLPQPEGTQSIFTSAVNTQGASDQVMVAEQHEAASIAFMEDIGIGAISKAGALPLGNEGEWLDFAESKLKKENDLDYQALLWEKGSELTENAQRERGGINITYEEELLKGLEEWFEKGGGRLNFAKPNVSTSDGFSLVATEDVGEFEPIISMPMKLIMCKQTARNVLIKNRGKYLGEELQKTFEKNELWGMTIFLLHEYYKEVAGDGSKWGPFIKTLRMRYLTTDAINAIKGTIAAHRTNEWLKGSDKFMWWSVGTDGPCSPTTGICKTKPKDRGGDSRFNIHQIRWAYWVVKQNAVKIKQVATGLEFVALIPYYHMLKKNFGTGGGITFDLDGTISVRAGRDQEEGLPLSIHPGNFSDAEIFLRYYTVPKVKNPNTEIKLKLPGTIPEGSKFHYCMKGSEKEKRGDECKGSYKSESMFWKSKVLTEWRKLMNLPPRLQELRMWATRLHLYGGKEEMDLLSNANMALAGLPLPVDQMPAEEQLMMLGVAKDNKEAALIVSGPNGGEKAAPQLYSAPDPEEDPEARRGMENLATLALQAQSSIAGGNTVLNATQVVLNATKDFFQHGVLPMAGLDELDNFLLKKIGMLSHCGFENDMKITDDNITEELFCAMRVHLMNESEMGVFCPNDVFVWEENCLNVEFMNYTAISEHNEMQVIEALRNSANGLLSAYPNTVEEDLTLLRDVEDGTLDIGPILHASYKFRFREKSILLNALEFLENYEEKVKNGTVSFQLELKRKEREEADIRSAAHKKFVQDIREQAAIIPELAYVEVDLGLENQPKANLTLQEGKDIKQTVIEFCRKYGVQQNYVATLESGLRKRVKSPPPLVLQLGVIIPATGDRKILAIPEGKNATVETGVFCTQNEVSSSEGSASDKFSEWCENLMKRVDERLNTNFEREILLVVPIDAPDSRKLKLIIRQGEQHDLIQYVSDFFQLYNMPQDQVVMMANEVHKRLNPVHVQVPVSIGNQRQINARFSQSDNITNVVNAFTNFYEIEDEMKIAIFKRARSLMAPGTFVE